MASPIRLSNQDFSTTIDLPKDLIWKDEFHTTQIAQVKKRTLTGSLVIFEDTKIEGRAISLNSDEDGGWIERAQLLTLREFIEYEHKDMILEFHGRFFNVRIDRSDPIRVVPVVDCSDPSPTSKYSLSIKFITIHKNSSGIMTTIAETPAMAFGAVALP